MIIDAGAYPSPLGYGGFPKSVCTSVNECMCHGIPDSRQLQVRNALQGAPCTVLNPFLTNFCFFPGELRTDVFLLWQDGDIINIDVTVYLNVCSLINDLYDFHLSSFLA